MTRRLILLTEGHSSPVTAKTACSLLRYRPQEVVAVLDASHAGKTSGEVLGVGQAPIVARLEEAPAANALLIGISPPGGQIPASWRPVLRQALTSGMDLISGMHEFLADDPELAALAEKHQAQLIDVRKNDFKTLARYRDFRESCLRIHTVGHDCSLGKMTAALEITTDLQRRGHGAKFCATGQTGIMVEGDGYPIDCVTADFVAGAAEQLVLDHQHHDILLIEGQGSLAHPSYSAVTLGVLHGCRPHGLIYCYEPGRSHFLGLDHVPLPTWESLLPIYQQMGGLHHPCSILGIAMNSRRLNNAEAEEEKRTARQKTGLPTCDVFRDGPETLTEAVLKLWEERGS